MLHIIVKINNVVFFIFIVDLPVITLVDHEGAALVAVGSAI